MPLSLRRAGSITPLTSIRGGREQLHQQLRTELLRAEAQLKRTNPEEHPKALLRFEEALCRFNYLVLCGTLPGHLDLIASDQSAAKGVSSLDVMAVLRSIYGEKEFLDGAVTRLESLERIAEAVPTLDRTQRSLALTGKTVP